MGITEMLIYLLHQRDKEKGLNKNSPEELKTNEKEAITEDEYLIEKAKFNN